MVSRIRTKGDLCGLTEYDETNYGVAGTTGAYAGIVRTIDPGDSMETEDLPPVCGSRAGAGKFLVARGSAPVFTVWAQRGSDILAGWLKRALGGVKVGTTVPSASYGVKVGPQEWHSWTGAVVDTLTLKGTEIGRPIEAVASLKARAHAISTVYTESTGATYQYPDGTSYTLKPANAPDTGYAVYDGRVKYDNADIPLQKSWELKISNNLKTIPDISGSGNSAYSLEAGTGAFAQASSIVLTVTVESAGADWDKLKMAFTTGKTVSLKVDGWTLTLTGCTLGGPEPTRDANSAYDEKLEFTASDLQIVKG